MRWLAIMLIWVTACSPASIEPEVLGEAVSADTGITLVLATYTAMGFEELIDQWEHEHPGVTVRILGGTWTELNDSLLAGYPVGESPDVAAVEINYMASAFASPSRFVDLRQFGADEIENRFLPWRWEHGIGPSGEILGIPTDVGGLAIAYRTDLFAAAGLPVDPDEVSALFGTWDGYLDVARQYNASTGLPFLDSSAWLFDALSNQSDQRYAFTLNAEGLYEPSETTRAAWKLAVEATQHSAGVERFSAGALNTDEPTKQFATTIAPAWMTNFIVESSPRSEGLWNIARIPGNRGNWGASQLTIPQGAEHSELAWDLISFLSTPAAQLAIFEDHGNFPSIPALYEHPNVGEHTNAFFNDARVGEIYADAVGQVSSAVTTRFDRQITEAFQAALDRLAVGTVDPDTAWNEAIDEIQATIAASEG